MARDDDFADRGNSPVDGWPPDFEHLVIPDDARELDGDARALARERRAAARAARLRAAFRVNRWHRLALPWPIAVAVLAMVSTLVSVLVVFRPPNQSAPRARPLASPRQQPGEVGGLLPDLQLRRDRGGLSSLRDFRPAVLVLTPPGYDSAGLLRTVLQVAGKHHVYALAVGPDVPRLPADLTRSALIRAGDAEHRLLPAYQVTDRPVLLLVRADGTVNQRLPGGPPDSVLDSEVVVLTG